MNAFAEIANSNSKKPPLLFFLGFVSLIFIGILIFAYVVTRRANPIYVDQNGRPTNAASSRATGRSR